MMLILYTRHSRTIHSRVAKLVVGVPNPNEKDIGFSIQVYEPKTMPIVTD